MPAPPEIARQIGDICAVSRETLGRLDHLVGAVGKWSRRINLVADARPDAVWLRHVLDSAQLFPLGRPAGRKWCDLGSGGGFPGLVIAILARELTPGQRVVMVESDRRKAAFLTVMAQELDLNTAIAAVRAEDLAPQQAETVSARALAPLPELLTLVARHLAEGGVALLPKGGGHAEEISHARRRWAFTVEPIESILAPRSRILRVTELRRADAA